MAYGRPIYTLTNESGAYIDDGKDGIEVIIYTGRRWFDTYYSEEDYKEMLEKDYVVHAYWDDLLAGKTMWYSEITEKYIPTGPITWYKLSRAGSAGNYGPFGPKKDAEKFRFECRSVNCKSRSGICGDKGKCEEEECKCDDDFEGHFCEFPAPTYSLSPSMSEYPTISAYPSISPSTPTISPSASAPLPVPIFLPG